MRHRLLKTPTIGLFIVAVLVAGCGVSTAHGVGAARQAAHSPAPSTTPTPASLPALAWRTRTLPSGYTGWAISPADGRRLWACVPVQGSDSNFTIWASRDEAATWARMSELAPAVPEPTSSCELVPDQGSATALAAVISWGSGEAGTLRSLTMLSLDSGAHWRRLPGDLQTLQLASASGKTYAIFNNTDETAETAPSTQSDGLVVSADGLRTWRVERPAQITDRAPFFQFWLGASANDLLAAAYENTLWRSTDGGAHWSRIPTPNQQTDLAAWLPQAGKWMFCGWVTANVQCSDDLGASWRQEPALSATISCASCGKGGAPYADTQPCYANAITGDGSLLAWCLDGTLHRLAPGAQTWAQYRGAPGESAHGPPLVIGDEVWLFGATPGTLLVATLPS